MKTATINTAWFGRGPKSTLFQRCIDSWKHTNTSWNIVEWNEDNVPTCRYLQDALSRREFVKCTEYARLYGVHQVGGIYLDCDVELVGSLDSLAGRNFFCRQQDGLINGAVFGAPAGDPLLAWLLRQFPKDGPATESALDYGPRFLTTQLFSAARTAAGLTCEILPPTVFFPYFWNEPDPGFYLPETLGVHRWAGSWA